MPFCWLPPQPRFRTYGMQVLLCRNDLQRGLAHQIHQCHLCSHACPANHRQQCPNALPPCARLARLAPMALMPPLQAEAKTSSQEHRLQTWEECTSEHRPVLHRRKRTHSALKQMPVVGVARILLHDVTLLGKGIRERLKRWRGFWGCVLSHLQEGS